MKRTFYLGALLLCLACVILPAQAAAIESGTCGNNLTWTLTDDGTLTISGTGEMNDYAYDVSSPWFSQRGNIKTARIEQGVTSIGDHAFEDCYSLISITIPESVTSIGDMAFRNCIYNHRTTKTNQKYPSVNL